MFVPHVITFIFLCNIFLVILTILLMLYLTFRMPTSGDSLNNTRKLPCMARPIPSLLNRLMQLRYHGVTEVTHQTYQPGLIAYPSFCFYFKINILPATSLRLQYFRADKSQSISYQTSKVYLTTI